MRPSLKERSTIIPLWWTFTLAAILITLFLICVVLVESGSFSHRQQKEEEVILDICVDLNDRNDVACNEAGDEEGPLPDVINPVPDNPLLLTIQEQGDIQQDKIVYKGISLAGGELRGVNLIPDDNDAHIFLYKGMNTFRIPIVWENFATMEGEIFENNRYVDNLDSLIISLLQHNASIVLVLYNSMRDSGNGPLLVFAPYVTTLWRNIVGRYYAPKMIYSPMNEEPRLDYREEIKLIAYNNIALTAIRQKERELGVPPHLVLLAGSNRNRIHRFWDLNNKRRLENFNDTGSNYASIVHAYFDSDNSGLYVTNECMNYDFYTVNFEYNFESFKKWMIENKQKIFIAEFGAPDTPLCRKLVTFFLNEVRKLVYSSQREYGFIGWTIWAAGKRWDNIEPFAVSSGSRANGLIWNYSLYENYLPPVAKDAIPEFREVIRRAIRITNNSPELFLYLDGYVPYQYIGAVNITPNGGTSYLYSNVDQNIPSDTLRIRYTTTDRNHVLTVGFFQVSRFSDQLQVEKSLETRDRSLPKFKLLGVIDGCDIIGGGPTAVRGDIRCYTIEVV